MKTILIADDEAVLRILVRTTLEDPQFVIHEAADGESALALVRELRPDLVLLDWMMPGLSGLELLQRLRADPATREQPVIMLTAKGQQGDRERAIAAGCGHFLAKPFSPLELLDTVQRILGEAPAPAANARGAELLPPEPGASEGQLALYARDLRRAYDKEQERTRQLLAASERLEDLNRLKSEFLRFVCHELRTPLNAMAALQLYDPVGDAREQAEVLELVRCGYERLERFIERGLEYFQWVARGRLDSLDTTDLGHALRQLLASRTELLDPAVRLELRLGAQPMLVPGLEAHHRIVLEALLDNALRFSPHEKRLALVLEQREGRVYFTCTDQGVGLRAESLATLFEPLNSADVAHHSSGTGLSLSLARVITEAHGGRIRAESAGLGRGATFRLELPARGTPAENAA